MFHSVYEYIFSFLGIGIVSDMFMGAIEKITSKTKKIHLGPGAEGPDIIEYPVWNGTVANLTLMALGEQRKINIVAILSNYFIRLLCT